MVTLKRPRIRTPMFLILIIIVIFLSTATADTSNPKISIYQNEFYVNEPFTIQVEAPNSSLSKLNIVINGGDSVYKFFGLTSNEIKFTPKQAINYTISLTEKNNIISEVTISVEKKNYTLIQSQGVSVLSTDKKVYELNQNVVITSKKTGQAVSLLVISKETTFKFLGLNKNTTSFYPKYPGVYEIRLLEKNNIISKTEIIVIDTLADTMQLLQNSTNPIQDAFFETSASGSIEYFRIHNTQGQVKFSKPKRLKSYKTGEEIYDLELSGKVKKISFKDLNTTQPSLGLDEVPAEKIKIENKKIVSSYAIDPEAINFSTAQVTATAQGTELYKCKDWSFVTQTCLGSWKKIRDLVPGQEYTFNLTPNDPGFAETGVSAINTLKPIYHPNETAEILIAVLDNQGYLVDDANINLTITTPSNITYSFFTPADIVRVDRGIYKAYFKNTLSEGNYLITVHAKARGTNATLTSNFKVQAFYEFDMIRDAPISIDPWKGPFSSSINITPYINISEITLIEKIPVNFTITDSGGAKVVDLPNEKNLIWENILPTAFVSYDVLAPKKSPELYSLGPAVISYTLGAELKQFYEARPWYVAADPFSTTESATKDAILKEFSPTRNFGTTDPITVNSRSGRNERIVIQFDISSLPTGVRIDSAFLELYITNPPNIDRSYSVYRVTSSWNEGTGSNAVNSASINGTTWDERWYTQNWGTAGGDYTGTATDTQQTGTTNNVWMSWNITSDVEGWYNGTYTNYGSLISDDNEDTDREVTNFASRTGATGQQPRLIINFTDLQAPNITGISDNPDPVDQNNNITIQANVTDNLGQGNISTVLVEIQGINYTMVYQSGDLYEYNYTATVFGSNTYIIYANDTEGNDATPQNGAFTVTAPSGPNVQSLDNPENNSLLTYSLIDFNFTVTSAKTLDHCALYMNINDNWSKVKNVSSPPTGAETNITYDPPDGVFLWNIYCEDNETVYDWYTYNYTVRIDTTDPNVTLGPPSDGDIDTDGNFTLTCTGNDLTDILNITLYTNLSGAWAPNQTINFTDINDSTAIANFNIYNVPDNTTFHWNCLAQDIANRTAWGPANYTLDIDFGANLPPETTLNSPPDNTTINSESVTLNCSATDDSDIASLNIFSNSSTDGWKLESTTNYPGLTDTNVTATHTLNNLPDSLTFIWNCQAIDSGNKKDWAPANYTVHIDLLKPNVTLDYPQDYWYDDDGNLTVNCTAYDNADIVNISLYTNAFGTWLLYSTQKFTGSTDTTAAASFNITGVSDSSSFEWNCLATDNQSYTSWADTNYTLTIPPPGTAYFATVYGYANTGGAPNSWRNPQETTLTPDGSTGDEDLDRGRNVYTFNYSGVPTQGTLLRGYHSIEWFVESSDYSDDELDLSYSPDNGTTWYDLDGSTADGGYDPITTYPFQMINQSYPITGSLNLTEVQTLYLRIMGYEVGSADHARAFIDTIFFVAQITPPPWYTNIKKNDSIIFPNETVEFNTTWHHEIGLGCYIFYINQSGTLENSGCIDMTGKNIEASYSWYINATPGTVVQWYFWANDTFGETNQTPIQYFTVADPDDSTSPVVNSVTITPIQDYSTQIFNITANITDDIGVANAYAELTYHNGTKINYSMTQIGGGVFWEYLHTSTVGGNYSVVVYGLDGIGNSNYSSPAYFNVTSLTTTEKIYYSYSETVRILGYGFSASEDVTLSIYNPSGSTIYGPINVTTNTDGTVNTTWNVPSSITTPLGNYTVELNDTTLSWLQNNTDFVVLHRVDSATQTDVVYPSGTDVTPELDDSDNLDITINGGLAGSDTTTLEMTFLDNIQSGYTINGLILYIEHIDLDPDSDNTFVEYYDGGTWQTASCSPISFSSSNIVSTCDLTADLGSIPDQDNIQIRLNYGTTQNNGVDLANINFTAIWVNFTIGNTLAITIDEPQNTISIIDYSGEPGDDNHDAYDGGTTSNNPPPAGPPPLTGTEASSTEYSKISVSDNNPWQTTITSNGDYAYQSFYFTVTQSVTDIIGFTFKYEGYATRETSYITDDFRIFAYNYSSETYVIISDNPITGTSSFATYSLPLPTPYSDFMDGSGNVNIVVVGATNAQDTPPNKARVDLYTDYVDLKIETITTITGFQDINATAVDGDGIAACEYHFTNSTGYDYVFYGMEEISLFHYHNISDTTDYPDGLYNLTVNCSDTGTEQNSTYITVKIANSPPTVLLVSPDNGTNYTSNNNVTFVWNASSALPGNLICDLYLDGTENISNIISQNGEDTNRTINNIDDGAHPWYVSCEVQGGASNSSETRIVNVDLNPPQITLDSPAADGHESSSTVNFTFTPSDAFNMTLCELIVDGSVVNTTSNVTNGAQNTLSNSGMSEGPHNWSVNCTDVHSFEGASATQTMYVDLTNPWISNHNPLQNQTLIGSFVMFNFTAYDNLADTLYCNITVDGFILSSDIPATNSSWTTDSIDVGDGFKWWNVTCWDYAGRTNTSETWNFTVQGDPTVNLISPDGTSTNESNMTFAYYVEDSNGIKNCSLKIDGVINQTNSSVNESATNYFYVNFTQEGFYEWTVLCYDNTDASTQPSPLNFTYDKTSPNVTALYPNPDDVFLIGDVTFNFTVTDNLDSSLTCNLSLNSQISATNNNFAAQNDSITTIQETGLAPDQYYWKIICWDDAGNTNESVGRYFDVGDLPTPDLIDPPNNGYSTGNVTFTYFINDSSGIENCSLYINDVFNQTNDTVNNGFNNYFYLYNLSEQTLFWNVLCVDLESESSFANQNYTLTIDNTAPNITLNYPDGDIIANSTINFNLTATDNNDTTLNCSFYIDDIFNHSFSATSGGNTIRTVSEISTAQHNWSVICNDSAGNTGYSAYNYFEVAFGPIVALTVPLDNAVDGDGNVDFNYTVDTQDANLSNCSLIINGAVNMTLNASDIPNIDNGWENNFTLTGLSQQILNWTVLCYDLNDVAGTDTTRSLHIDWEYPYINLSYPANEDTVALTSIDFNFTAYDNVDDYLLCNMTFSNSSFNQYNISAQNTVPEIVNINGFYAGTFYWNVTCTDGSQTNISQTWNFTVSVKPIINLQTPPNNDVISYNNVNFTYIPQTIASLGFQYCQLIWDGQNNVFDPIITNGALNWLYNASLQEGKHNWTVFCLDQDNENNTGDVWNLTIDLTNPTVYSNFPDGDILNSSTVTFNITAIDNLSSQLTCNITVNGSDDITGWTVNNNTPSTQSAVGYTDGLFYWNATCADEAGRTNTSSTKNFTVAEPPIISLGNPPDNTRTKTTTQTFYYTPTDNSGNISSCELILNGAVNATNTTINESAQNNITTTLAYGEYNWTVNCTDFAGNIGTQNTTSKIIIDTLGPSIQMNSPQEDDFFNQDYINFNWTPTDEFGTNIFCNLTVDGVVNQPNISTTSGQVTNWTVNNMTYGQHNWSVKCWDDLNNTNTSQTINFTVNAPDAYIDNTRISFNNSNPDINENITITAQIENIGGVPATDFTVEFWLGNRTTGTLLGNNTVTIPSGTNITTNTTWIITQGYHTINVYVNPDQIKAELNYSNNNATLNISVLISNITSPQNDTWTQDTTPEINFTLQDFTSGTINYTILVDGSPNGQSGQVADNTSTSINLTALSDGTYYIQVRATDSLNRSKDSNRLYINIDTTPAAANFITPNQTWFNITNPTIEFNLTDNLDTNINYTFYVNTTSITSSNLTNNTYANQTIGPYSQGQYNITIETLDEAGNTANYTIIIYIDWTNPQLILESPQEGANFSTSSVVLNISVTDNLDPLILCNITLDSSVVNSSNVTNGSYNAYTANNLFEGTYYWNATCIDSAGNKNTSETRSFNVALPPDLIITNPQDNYWSNLANNTFYFNVTDQTGIENCSLLINGQINQTKPGSQITMGEISNISSVLSEGAYNWSIICYDNTTNYMSNTSSNRTIYVDLSAPNPVITTVNQTWFNTLTPTIFFNLTDNMAQNINYTFIVDSLPNASGQVANPTIGGSDVINISNAMTHTVILQATDQAGNTANSTPITIYYDGDLPEIELLNPPNGNFTSNDSVKFSFRARDSTSQTLDCNLTINSVVNQTFYNITTGGAWNTTNKTVSGFLAGTYFWNVTCADYASNSNISATWNFTVPFPDLLINSGNITFNNTSPEELTNITVFANIYSIGNVKAQNITVQFYEGDPDTGGTQINGNKTIALLDPGQNQTVNVTWTVPIGTVDVYVVVDPPTATNGTINEDNESNNKAYKTFSVSSYHTVLGNLSGVIEITNAVYSLLYEWSKENVTGDNILVTDYDSTIDWFSIQAVSRDTSDVFASDDFEDIDAALGSTNYSDSINTTWTSGGSPLQTQQFTVFQNTINNVPIVNSTNTSNFVTGILWDYSDGNAEYNGTQDLIFITEINEQKQGFNGIVDFEIKIPALLRAYQAPDPNRVTFYTELK